MTLLPADLAFEDERRVSSVQDNAFRYNPPKMPFINPSFQRWPEKRKWLWRVVMIFVTILNAWEWFHDIALGRTVAAVTDVVFVLIALCVIVASFFGRGKSAMQGR